MVLVHDPISICPVYGHYRETDTGREQLPFFVSLRACPLSLPTNEALNSALHRRSCDDANILNHNMH
jgi:hypothetical protein